MLKQITVLIILFFIISCGENKNSQTTINAKKTISKDTTKKEEIDTLKIETPKYPGLTQDNIVSFLTQYGLENPETKVKITTNHGDIEIELFKNTPLHRANFIYLVKQKYFDGTFFHRVVPNFIIQGGNSDNINTPRKRTKIGNTYLLPAEINPQIKHTYGTISGAKEYRENPDKMSAPFEFFIFLGPDRQARHLNGDYTIFGKVTKGMEVVEKIANLPRDSAEWPKQNVYILAQVML